MGGVECGVYRPSVCEDAVGCEADASCAGVGNCGVDLYNLRFCVHAHGKWHAVGQAGDHSGRGIGIHTVLGWGFLFQDTKGAISVVGVLGVAA